MHAFSVTQFLYSLHRIVEWCLWVHLVRPELICLEQPVEVGHLQSRQVTFDVFPARDEPHVPSLLAESV